MLQQRRFNNDLASSKSSNRLSVFVSYVSVKRFLIYESTVSSVITSHQQCSGDRKLRQPFDDGPTSETNQEHMPCLMKDTSQLIEKSSVKKVEFGG